jgi:putative ABC transport system substrate-binding protein
MMDRRHALAALGGAGLAIAFPAGAQRGGIPVIGILYTASSKEWPHRFAALRQGLAELGYIEGQNVAFDVRLLEGQYDRVPEAASDLVRRQVALIVATGGPQVAFAAKAATTAIPIVVTFGGDPVKAGLVASLNRPGGNVTGVAILTVELAAKLIDVFHELLPKVATVALLVDPDNPVADAYATAAQDAAHGLGLQLHVLKARTEGEIDAAFAALAGLRAGGLLVAADPFFEIRREQLIALAERLHTPTFYFVREFVVLGGLASYGTSFNDAARAVGLYAGRILKGTKPADLPVLEPTKFELVINLKTAKALGLTIPQSLLQRADEVIQ